MLAEAGSRFVNFVKGIRSGDRPPGVSQHPSPEIKEQIVTPPLGILNNSQSVTPLLTSVVDVQEEANMSSGTSRPCSKENEATANEQNGPVPFSKENSLVTTSKLFNSEGDGAAANSKSNKEMDELVADFKSNIELVDPAISSKSNKIENGAEANSKMEEPVSNCKPHSPDEGPSITRCQSNSEQEEATTNSKPKRDVIGPVTSCEFPVQVTSCFFDIARVADCHARYVRIGELKQDFTVVTVMNEYSNKYGAVNFSYAESTASGKFSVVLRFDAIESVYAMQYDNFRPTCNVKGKHIPLHSIFNSTPFQYFECTPDCSVCGSIVVHVGNLPSTANKKAITNVFRNSYSGWIDEIVVNNSASATLYFQDPADVSNLLSIARKRVFKMGYRVLTVERGAKPQDFYMFDKGFSVKLKGRLPEKCPDIDYVGLLRFAGPVCRVSKVDTNRGLVCLNVPTSTFDQILESGRSFVVFNGYRLYFEGI